MVYFKDFLKKISINYKQNWLCIGGDGKEIRVEFKIMI